MCIELQQDLVVELRISSDLLHWIDNDGFPVNKHPSRREMFMLQHKKTGICGGFQFLQQQTVVEQIFKEQMKEKWMETWCKFNLIFELSDHLPQASVRL